VVHLMQGARGFVPAFLRSLVSRTVPIVLMLAAMLAFGVWLLGSHNPYTPAGYVGYLTKGAVFGQSRFYGVQRGPTSPGRSWLLDVTNAT
jgi:hypothetical protein